MTGPLFDELELSTLKSDSSNRPPLGSKVMVGGHLETRRDGVTQELLFGITCLI